MVSWPVVTRCLPQKPCSNTDPCPRFPDQGRSCSTTHSLSPHSGQPHLMLLFNPHPCSCFSPLLILITCRRHCLWSKKIMLHMPKFPFHVKQNYSTWQAISHHKTTFLVLCSNLSLLHITNLVLMLSCYDLRCFNAISATSVLYEAKINTTSCLWIKMTNMKYASLFYQSPPFELLTVNMFITLFTHPSGHSSKPPNCDKCPHLYPSAFNHTHCPVYPHHHAHAHPPPHPPPHHDDHDGDQMDLPGKPSRRGRRWRRRSSTLCFSLWLPGNQYES